MKKKQFLKENMGELAISQKNNFTNALARWFSHLENIRQAAQARWHDGFLILGNIRQAAWVCAGTIASLSLEAYGKQHSVRWHDSLHVLGGIRQAASILTSCHVSPSAVETVNVHAVENR